MRQCDGLNEANALGQAPMGPLGGSMGQSQTRQQDGWQLLNGPLGASAAPRGSCVTGPSMLERCDALFAVTGPSCASLGV